MASPGRVSIESTLERRCRDIAKERGALLLKIQGARGWPDRVLLRPPAQITWIEFKREGERPRPLQMHILESLRKMGFRAVYVDTVEGFKHELDRS